MANLNLSINLTALHHACILSPKNRNGIAIKGVFIPIIDNNLIEGKNGVYLSANAWETPDSQYGNSHMIKLATTKEQRDALPKDQLNAYQCIIGNAKPFEFKKNEGEPKPAAPVESADGDLPF